MTQKNTTQDAPTRLVSQVKTTTCQDVPLVGERPTSSLTLPACLLWLVLLFATLTLAFVCHSIMAATIQVQRWLTAGFSG